MSKNKKVLVALSGGIDSSAAAFLLKKKGYEVSAVFMRFWKETKEENKCCSAELEAQAKKVCQKLEIPFYVFDFRKEFKKWVVDDFLRAYKKGLTPNPCVVCNEKIKIGLLLKKARAMGFDFLATGHYARIWEDKNGFHLGVARDLRKDQSYFLYRLSRDDIKYLLFPLGEYLKSEVKEIVKKSKIPAKLAVESQEICFVPGGDIASFLKQTLIRETAEDSPPLFSGGLSSAGLKRGEIVDSNGKKLGIHSGLSLYTLGQRRGIGLSGGPFYVLKKDFKKNQLVVTKDKKELYRDEFFVGPLFWHAPRAKKAAEVLVKTRSTDKFRKAKVIFQKNKTKVVLKNPCFAPTPGQSAVFYKDTRKKPKEVLGGGIILTNG